MRKGKNKNVLCDYEIVKPITNDDANLCIRDSKKKKLKIIFKIFQ